VCKQFGFHTIVHDIRWCVDAARLLASVVQVAFDVFGRVERFTVYPEGPARPCGRGPHTQCLHSGNSRIAATCNRESRGLVVPKCSESWKQNGGSMKNQVANKKVVARLRGFEPPTSGSGDHFERKS